MAQIVNLKDDVPFSAEAVLEKMLDTKFIEEWTVVQQGLNPRASIVEKSDTRVVMRVDMEEPIPAIGTVKAHMTFTWDIPGKKCNWVRVGEGVGAKSNVHGTTTIMPNGPTACQFMDTINVEVNIPLLGKKLEQAVLDYTKKGRPGKMAFLNRKLAG